MDGIDAAQHLCPEELAHVGVDLVELGVGAEHAREVRVSQLHHDVEPLQVRTVLTDRRDAEESGPAGPRVGSSGRHGEAARDDLSHEAVRCREDA